MRLTKRQRLQVALVIFIVVYLGGLSGRPVHAVAVERVRTIVERVGKDVVVIDNDPEGDDETE